MSSFGTYLLGFFILIVGLAVAAYLLNVPTLWILVGVIVMIGIGILMATQRTKPRDPPATGTGTGGGYGAGGNPPAGPRA
jgi:hypothetical protein